MKTALISFRNTDLGYDSAAEQALVWAFNAGGIHIDDITGPKQRICFFAVSWPGWVGTPGK